jgi:hypothetical protein
MRRSRQVTAPQPKPSHGGYACEADLVAHFVEHLAADPRWSAAKVGREFFYARGRTDVVLLIAGELVAVEAKLERWRDALQQAYRNRCFAHRTYVVLPSSTALRAHRYEHEFRRRGVGLLVVSDDGIVEFLDSDAQEPLQAWLSDAAIAAIGDGGCEWPTSSIDSNSSREPFARSATSRSGDSSGQERSSKRSERKRQTAAPSL